jgi:hypothetical protein
MKGNSNLGVSQQDQTKMCVVIFWVLTCVEQMTGSDDHPDNNL